MAPAVAVGVPLEGESCPPTLPGASAVAACGEGRAGSGGSGGGGSLNVGALLPIVGGIVAAGAAVLLAALLILRRRTLAPAAPADPTEWWTCRKCGKANVIGSPRCYACGEWQG